MALIGQQANTAFNVKPNPIVQTYYSSKSDSQQTTQPVSKAPTSINQTPSSVSGSPQIIGQTPTPTGQTANTAFGVQANPLVQSVQQNQGNTLSSQLSTSNTNQVTPLSYSSLSGSSTPTGYVKSYVQTPYDVLSANYNNPLEFLGALQSSIYNMNNYPKSDIRSGLFQQQQSDITNIASQNKYAPVSKYLVQPESLGYSQFYSDVSNPIIKERQEQYNNLQTNLISNLTSTRDIYQQQADQGGDVNLLNKQFQSDIQTANKQLNVFDLPTGQATDILGQPISKVPSFLQSNNLPLSFQPTLNIQQVYPTKTSEIIGQAISPDLGLLQKGYSDIALSKGISSGIYQGTTEAIGFYGGTYGAIGLTQSYPEIASGLNKAFIGVGSYQTIKGGIDQNFNQVVQGAAITTLGGFAETSMIESEISNIEIQEQLQSNLNSFNQQNVGGFRLGQLTTEGVEIQGESGSVGLIKGYSEAGNFRQTIISEGYVIPDMEGGSTLSALAQRDIAGTFTYEPVFAKEFSTLRLKPTDLLFASRETGTMSGKQLSTPLSDNTFFFKGEGEFQPLVSRSSLTNLNQPLNEFKSNYLNQFNKVYTGVSSKGNFVGFTGKLNDEYSISRFGKINKLSLDFYPNEDLLKVDIGADLKNYMITKNVGTGLQGEEGEFGTKSGGSEFLYKQSTQTTTSMKPFLETTFENVNAKALSNLDTKSVTKSISKGFRSSGFGGQIFDTGQRTITRDRFKEGGFYGSSVFSGNDFISSNRFGSLISPTPKVKSINTFSPISSQSSIQGLGLGQINVSVSGFKPITPQPIIPIGTGGFGFDFGGFGGFGKLPDMGFNESGNKKRKKKAKRTNNKILPSFTAEVFNIRGSLPKDTSFGINPFQMRKIPKGRKNPYETKF